MCVLKDSEIISILLHKYHSMSHLRRLTMIRLFEHRSWWKEITSLSPFLIWEHRKVAIVLGQVCVGAGGVEMKGFSEP